MDLIEVLQKQIEEENAESSTDEGSDVEKAGEDESDNINDDEEGTGSDAEEEELSNDKIHAVDDESKNVSDGIEEKKLDKSANEDSEVHALNSDMEEDGEKVCLSPEKKTKNQASCKRKQIGARKGAGKKARKCEEVSIGVEDAEDNQKMQDAEGSHEPRGHLRKNQIQANGSSPLSPCTQNRRVTRQMKLRGES